MFTKLMDDLYSVYEGDVIYIPLKLKVFIEPWLQTKQGSASSRGFQGRGGFQKATLNGEFSYKDKKVLFFCEDKLSTAYKKMPVPHQPEKITEEAFVIEFTLEERKAARRSSKPWEKGAAKKVQREDRREGMKLW